MDDPGESDEKLQALVEELTEKLRTNTRRIGLYMEHVGIVSRAEPEGGMVFQEKDFRESVDNGDVLVVGMFAVGDVAFEKRTLNPEQEEFDRIAREMLPDPVEELREKLRQRKAEGRDLFEEEDSDG